MQKILRKLHVNLQHLLGLNKNYYENSRKLIAWAWLQANTSRRRKTKNKQIDEQNKTQQNNKALKSNHIKFRNNVRRDLYNRYKCNKLASRPRGKQWRMLWFCFPITSKAKIQAVKRHVHLKERKRKPKLQIWRFDFLLLLLISFSFPMIE